MPTLLRRFAPLCALTVTVGAVGFFTFAHRVPAQTPVPAVEAKAEEPAPPSPYKTRKICDLPDERIDESSGLAASRRYPGCLWTHNDSGDTARLFLLNSEGKTLSEIKLKGITARDWEDMAIAGSGKDAWVYVGDIGDNLEVRPSISIHRFREPDIELKNPPDSLEVSFETLTLTYPGGARNAETLIAAPNGQLLIVTKSLAETFAFATPEPFAPGATMELKKLGEVSMPQGIRGRMTTGGDISADGKKLVVITYTQTHEWTLPGWKKDGAPQWSGLDKLKPRTWNLPKAKQMEAACYAADSARLFTTSEQRPAPLFEFTPTDGAR